MRVNVGVNPKFLADQHLCELAELKMAPGKLQRHNYQYKGALPSKFTLNTGHCKFFYDKLQYLQTRWKHVHNECLERGRYATPHFYNLRQFPDWSVNDWKPTMQDSMVVRERICNRLKEKPGWYKYYGAVIKDIDKFCKELYNSPLYIV